MAHPGSEVPPVDVRKVHEQFNHAPEELNLGNFREQLFRWATKQEWVRDAAVYFAMTAVFERSAWKYRHPRGLRNIFLDAGHLSQTLYLVAAALGLGCCISSALLDSELENLIQLDGINEAVVSLSAVGLARGR